MKIRTDFVTNSSSSSFTFLLTFELADDSMIMYRSGGSETTEMIVTVSPKQLGQAANVDELIRLLGEGVIYKTRKGEEKILLNPTEDQNDIQFLQDIREKIHSMDDIVWITLEGHDAHYDKHDRIYTYDRVTGEYVGYQFRERREECGGDLCLEDLDTCDIKYELY